MTFFHLKLFPGSCSEKIVLYMYVVKNEEDDLFRSIIFFSEIAVESEPFYPINKLNFYWLVQSGYFL